MCTVPLAVGQLVNVPARYFPRSAFSGCFLAHAVQQSANPALLPAVQDGLFAREFTRFQAHALAKVRI